MIIRKNRVYISAIAVVVIIVGVITPISLFIANSKALSQIFYKINYNGTVPNFEIIIEKSELFEYEQYCMYRDSWGEGPLNASVYFYKNIDREFIESLKLKIESEKTKFHFYAGDYYNFIYSVEVYDESVIFLTYNNNNIIKAEYANLTEIFAANQCWDYNINDYTSNWEGNWYLNFTQIPSAPSEFFTIALNNTFIVKMNLEYSYSCGFACWGDVRFEQYLCFNSDIETIFVYFPFASHSVT